VVGALLILARIGPGEVVYDLGAGTGSVVFAAARAGARRVVGVEIEPLRVLILRCRRRLYPHPETIEIRRANLFRMPLDGATVVVAFLWPSAMERLGEGWKGSLPDGLRIVSHFHPIPGWTPTTVDPGHRLYLYVVPQCWSSTVEVDPESRPDQQDRQDHHGPGNPAGVDAPFVPIGGHRHERVTPPRN